MNYSLVGDPSIGKTYNALLLTYSISSPPDKLIMTATKWHNDYFSFSRVG
jgi:hypothetical protein